MRTVLVNCRVTAGTLKRNGKASVHDIRVTQQNAWAYPFASAAPEQLPMPEIEIPTDDPITDVSMFSIRCEIAEAKLFYSIDGTTPSSESEVYTEPFALGQTGNITIKAIAIMEGWLDSEVASVTVTVKPGGLLSVTLIKHGTGAVAQEMRIGNTQDFLITVQTGTIAAVSAGTIAPDGKSATVTGIADSGSSDYRTITFAAMGGTTSDQITITKASTIHRLEHNQATNGAGISLPAELPAGITYLRLSGTNINNSINWTYNGAVPAGLTVLYLSGANINWTYNGAVPAGLTVLYLSGANINWTYNQIPQQGNITVLTLLNHRVAKMSSADMVVMLTSLAERAGTLPATITINDYADYANPPQSVIDAVAALKAAKPNVTTVNLGA